MLSYLFLVVTSQVDSFGTQQPIALLKLLFENGGFYDRGKDLNWKQLKDISKYVLHKGLVEALETLGNCFGVFQSPNLPHDH